MKRIAFVVNGDPAGAMAHRAAAFAQRLPDTFSVRTFFRPHRGLSSVFTLARQIRRSRPDVVYIFDMAFSGVLAGTLCRWFGRIPLVIDTGDAISALAKAIGRGRIGTCLTQILEGHSLRIARRIVVRGSYHQELLLRRGIRAEWIPDGVETDLFRPMEVQPLRDSLFPKDCLTIGVLGSVIWNPRTQSCYGSELLEVISRLRDLPVQGLLIGGGSGLDMLKERAAALGIADRIRFLGPKPYAQLPEFINLMDVALSTQTNDLPGQVRTTGKLPLYLACGRFILASRVGEAARVLPESMLVDYHGSFDPEYPARLADRIAHLVSHRDLLRSGIDNVAVASATFDYNILTQRLSVLLDTL